MAIIVSFRVKMKNPWNSQENDANQSCALLFGSDTEPNVGRPFVGL